jgi:acyl carrier protein
MAAKDEIRTRVKGVLVQALGVEAGEVTPSATLLGDLGAESIDLLDIVFRLEREFRIEVPRGELFIEALFRDDPEDVREDRLTDEGLVELRARMPYADPSDFGRVGRPCRVVDMFTVDLLVRYVAWKLDSRGGAVTSPEITAPVTPDPIRR